MKKRKFSNIIFDLDGVILNSESNMRKSWQNTSKKFNLNIDFISYKKFIGLPFKIILKKLKVKNSFKKIEKFYKNESIKDFGKLRLYKNVKKELDLFHSRKINYAIVTSKDLIRSKKILHKFKLKPLSLHCPNNKLRGKPFPDHINYCIKKNKFQRSITCYVGDTYFDYISSKKAKIPFIFASYGFGKQKKIYRRQIKNFSLIQKFLN